MCDFHAMTAFWTPLQAGLQEQGHIYQGQQDWHLHQGPNGGSQRLRGQNPKGPAAAMAMASSKLLEDAVKACVTVCS